MPARRFTRGTQTRPRFARPRGALGAIVGAVLLVLATTSSAQALIKPTFVTQASSSVPLGAAISDKAVLVGAPLGQPRPTGKVTFTAYGPDDTACAGTPAVPPTDVTVAAKNEINGPSFTPTKPGTYIWIASYSGDSVYQSVTGKCTDSTESTLVTAYTPIVTTVASPSVAVGGTVTDTASLTTGPGLAAPTGTVRFRIYQPSDTTCAGPAVGGSDVAIGDPASVTSQPYSPPIAGTFHWRAFYLGDHVNGIATTACNDPNESVAVTPGPAPPLGTGPGPGPAPAPGSPGGAIKPLVLACDANATAKAVSDALVATLTGQPGAGFKSSCSAGIRIVLRAKEVRPGNPGFPRRDGFTTMANILSHIAPNGPALNFTLNPNGLALRDYAVSKGLSLVGFLIVHIRPDKSQASTESVAIVSLG